MSVFIHPKRRVIWSKPNTNPIKYFKVEEISASKFIKTIFIGIIIGSVMSALVLGLM